MPIDPPTVGAQRGCFVVAADRSVGCVPFPLQLLTPHSLSRRVRDLLNGDLGAHRDLPVDPDEDTEPARLAPVPVVGRGVYSREDSQRAWTRRRADLKKNTVIDDVLAEIDFRAKELERRTADVSAQGRGSGRRKRLGFRPIFMLD